VVAVVRRTLLGMADDGGGASPAVAREAPGARQPYFTLAPTTASHCLVITSFALFCWSSVGNTALA